MCSVSVNVRLYYSSLSLIALVFFFLLLCRTAVGMHAWLHSVENIFGRRILLLHNTIYIYATGDTMEIVLAERPMRRQSHVNATTTIIITTTTTTLHRSMRIKISFQLNFIYMYLCIMVLEVYHAVV